MKLTYEALAAHPRIFLSFTGLEPPEEFLVLLMDIDYAWQVYEIGQLIDSFPRQPSALSTLKLPVEIQEFPNKLGKPEF